MANGCVRFDLFISAIFNLPVRSLLNHMLYLNDHRCQIVLGIRKWGGLVVFDTALLDEVEVSGSPRRP